MRSARLLTVCGRCYVGGWVLTPREHTPIPPPREQTHTYENFTFPQLPLRTVIILSIYEKDGFLFVFKGFTVIISAVLYILCNAIKTVSRLFTAKVTLQSLSRRILMQIKTPQYVLSLPCS